MAGSKEIRAGKAYVEISAKDKLTKGLLAAKKKLEAFSKSVTAIGTKIALVGTAVGGLLGFAVKSFMGYGDELDKMSARTGLTVEELSELRFACQQSGVAITDLEGAVRDMNKGFSESLRGEGQFGKALKQVGLSAKQLKGLSVDERFELIAQALDKVKDSSIKSELAMKLFGGSGQKLLPLLGNIQQLRKEARDLGLTISSTSVKDATALVDAWGRITAQIKVVIYEIGAALAPTLTAIADKMKVWTKAVLNFIRDHKQLVVTIAKITLLVTALGVALIALGAAIKIVSLAFGAMAATWTVIKVILGIIFSKLGLITAIVATLATVILQKTGLMSKALDWFSAKWKKLQAFAAETMQGIKDAIDAGDLVLAFKILWLSIKMIWLKGIQPLREMWLKLKYYCIDTWNEFCFNIRDAWSAVSYWLTDAWDETIYTFQYAWFTFCNFFSEIWGKVTGGIAKTWNIIIGGMAKAWIKFKGLFTDSIDVDAEIKSVDDETNMYNKAIDEENETLKKQHEQKMNDLAAERAVMQQAIADQRAAEKDKIATERAQVGADSTNAYQSELEAVQRELAAVKEERRKALEEARRKAAEAKNKTVEPETKGSIETAITSVKGATEGAFYADQINGLNWTNDNKRTAEGVEKLVTLTVEANRMIKRQTGKIMFVQ